MQISIANAIQVARRIGSAAAEVITTNLKMWLGFETSSIDGDEQITPDKSGNNNVGELFTGKALEFDGNLDSVTFTSYPTSIKSVVFWYKPLASQQFDSIIWLGGSRNGTIGIQNNYGTINCTNLSGKVIYVNGVQTESVTLNQWQRVVINFPSKTLLGLGFGRIGANYGDCQLSDIQFYNENLSLDDIAYDYANPQNLLTDRDGTSVVLADLRGYWALSEGAGSIVYDSSGGNHNGTINGATYEPAQPRIPQLGMMNFSNGAVATGVTLIPDPNNTSQDIDGNAVRDRLNSFNLDGSGYSSVANSSTLQFGTSAFTIQAWIKPFSLAANNRILTKGVTGNGEFMISVGGDGASARVYAKDSSGNALDTSNDFSSLTINSWQMITVIIDTPNDQILFFKNDGNVETKTGASWTGNFNNTKPITIGNTSSVSAGQFFDGLVSDALVYDRALTSDEVENNYNVGLSAHTNN